MISKFTQRLLSATFVGVSVFNVWVHRQVDRSPAAAKQIELHIKNLFINEVASKRLEGRVFIRTTFSDAFQFEFGKDENLLVSRGHAIPLDYKIDINEMWVKDDQMPFKIELVSMEGFKKILVRCQQTARGIQEYDRSFQCFIPGQKKSFLSYRLGDKNSVKPGPQKLVQVR